MNEKASSYAFLYFLKKDNFLRFGRSIESQGDEWKTNERAEKFVISTLVGLYGNIRDLAHPTAVVHIQLQPVSPGIWHVVSQRSQPDSPSDSWRITVIACLWSLTSSWSHNYRMASRSINERHRRCCTRRARSTRPCACMRISLSSGTFE